MSRDDCFIVDAHERDFSARYGGRLGIENFDFEIGGEGRGGEKTRSKKTTTDERIPFSFSRERVVGDGLRRSPGLRVRTLSGSVERGVLPRTSRTYEKLVPSERPRVSSLTVARQRGICTRFP